MKKVIKYSLNTFVGLIIVLGVALVSILTLVNPNRFKPYISKIVLESTGRNITLAGDLRWNIYPNLGLSMQQVSLSNPRDFAVGNFMYVESADVSVGLIPLLSNHLVFKTLAVDGLQLNLIEQHGQNNWTFTPPASESTPSGGPASAPKPLHLDLSAFSFKNATIHYDNQDKHQHYALKNANLVVDTDFAGAIKYDQSTNLLDLHKVNFNYNDAAKGSLDLRISALNQDDPHYAGELKISKLALNSLLADFAHPLPTKLELLDNLSFKGKLAGDKNNLSLTEFSFNLGTQLAARFDLRLKNFTNPSYSGRLEVTQFDLNQLLNSLKIASAARKNMPLLDGVDFKTSSFSGDMSSLRLKGVELHAGGMFHPQFNTLVIQNFANPAISGEIRLATTNLNQVLDGLGIAVAARKNKPLLNAVAVSGGFAVTSNTLSLKNFNFSCANLIRGTTTLNLQNFAKPQYSGTLNLPSFSLNGVMDQLGMEPPKLSNPHLLDQVTLSSNLSGSTNSVNLSGMHAKIAHSSFSGNLNIKSFSPLTLSEDLMVDQLNLTDFATLNGFSVPLKNIHIAGSANLNKNLELNSLNAKQNLQIGNISVLGISLDRLVGQLDQAIGHTGSNSGDVLRTVVNSGQVLQAVNNMKHTMAAAMAPAARDLKQTTNLGALVGAVTINHGVINPSTLKLAGPSVALAGGGSLNLSANQAINYKVNSQLLTAGINPLIAKLVFPVTVGGSLKSPTATIDWGSVEQQLLKYLLANNKQQIQQTVKQQINQALGNAQGSNPQQNQAADAVSRGVTNVLGKLFGQ